MQEHAAELRRLDALIWGIIAAVGVTVLAVTLISDFRLQWASFLAPSVATALCAAGQWFYRTYRVDHRLAAALGSTSQLIAFAAVGAPLSYIGASLALPLQDRWLDAADRAVGLDWPTWLDWLNAHAMLHPPLYLIYFSLMPQTVIVVLALSFAGQLGWLRTYMLAFVTTTLATIALAALIPAEGAWGFYQLTPPANIVTAVHGQYLSVFNGLRDGSFRLLMAAGSQGIITFPSLHAALGLLLTVALWPIRGVRWIGLAVNGIMIISVPVEGGHYFIDVVFGLAVACASLAIARVVANRAHESARPISAIGLAHGS